MAIFQPEEVQLFDSGRAQRIEKRYQQLPTVVPLTVEPEQLFLMKKERDNNVPIVAIVGIVSLLAFFGLLAFLYKSR